MPIDPNLLQLDAEQINGIMAYVVMKAGMADLMGQIRLIEEFTSEDQQESKEGQAFYTLKIAAELLKDRHYEFQEIISPEELQPISRSQVLVSQVKSFQGHQRKNRARHQPTLPSQNPNSEAKLSFISNSSNAQSQVS